MTRTLLTLACTLTMVASLSADVTIKSTGTGKVLGMSPDMTSTTYVKDMKMRVDNGDGDKIKSVIFDLDNQKMFSFDNKKKEADVWDMATVADDMAKVVSTGEIKSSVRPNGQTKQIGGKTANGYDIEVVVPFMMGGDKGMAMTMTMTGKTWVVKGAPGTADYAAFYKGAAERGWIFQDPKSAKASPGQAKANAKMYEQFASLGGIPYETEIEMKGSGDGMAGLMAKAMHMQMTTSVQSVEAGTLPAEMFAPPAGYKLNVKK
ncbi:MAG TPA: hypothetical protein VFV78_02050 [Vicinamibacterales bacterium]|nr:hypothetical protein [Vicinamibacterales bacterium]